MTMLLILAGGQSRRMGQDKAMAELSGKRLIDHIIARMPTQNICISGSGNYGTGLPFIPDTPDGPKGPAAALWAAGSRFAEHVEKIPGFVSVPVDMPFLPEDMLSRLSADPDTARFACSPQYEHTACAWWPLARLRSALASPGMEAPSLRHVLALCGAIGLFWPDEASFTNINTPEELAAAQAWLNSRPATD